jgi:radical SAM protein with 4Fe4S-binding SPASM domain
MPLVESFPLFSNASTEIFHFPQKLKEKVEFEKIYFLKVFKKGGKVFLIEPFLKKIYVLSQKDWLDYKKKTKNLNYFKEKLKIPKKLRILHLVLAPHCNLKCNYCIDFSFKKRPQFLSFEQLKIAVDFLAKESPVCGISFVTSGEPTLNFKVLKKGLSYIKKKLRPKRLEISTNGVFLSKSQILWLANNFQVLQISLDGPPEIQDFQRPLFNGQKSSIFVERTIKVLTQEKKNFKVSCTITPFSVGKEKEIFTYFWRLGIKNLNFHQVYSLRSGKKVKGNFKKEKRKIFRSLFKLKEWFDFSGLHPTIQPDYIFESKTLFSCPVGTAFVVSPENLIFACPLLSTKEDFKFQKNAKELLIGNLNLKQKKLNIDYQKLEKLKKFHLLPKECQKCDFKFCFGGCFLTNKFKGKRIIPDKNKCWEEKIGFYLLGKYLFNQYLFQFFPHFETKNNSLFLRFLFSNLKVSNKKGPFFEKIDLENTNYSKLLKDLLPKLTSKNAFSLLLISPIQKNPLNKEKALSFEKFLTLLSKFNIPFRITKPIVFSFEIPEIEKRFYSNFPIPRNCYQCLEMFKVQKNKIIFCNGEEIKNIQKERVKIYQKFKQKTFSNPPSCIVFFSNLL